MHRKTFEYAINTLKESGYGHFKSVIKKRYIVDFRNIFFYLFKQYSGYKILDDFNNEDLPKKIKLFRKKKPKIFNSFFKACKLTSAFNNLFNNNEIQMLASKILTIKRESVIISETQLRVDEPKDNLYTLDWHQDSPYYPQAINGADSIVLNIFVQNCFSNMGSVKLIKGSHKNGMLNYKQDTKYNKQEQNKVEKKYIKIDNITTVEPEECDVVVYDMNLIHKSGYNASNKSRISIIGRAFNPFSKSFIPYQYKNIELIK